MSDLLFVFALGLAGSAHCVGMCGGFVLALSGVQPGQGTLHLRQAAYFAGKTATYALMGGLAGAFGGVLLGLAGFQQGVSLVLGGVLVAMGLMLCGVWSPRTSLARYTPIQRLSGAITGLVRRGTLPAVFGLGLLNGLLPCGLVAAMLVHAAATGSAAGGALTLAVFGAATVPALYLTGLTGFLMRGLWRQRLVQISGVLVLLMGVLTLARATPVGEALLHRALGHGASAEAAPGAHPHAH